MAKFDSINPATGEVLDSYPLHSDREVDSALDRSTLAQKAWAARPVDERLGCLAGFAELLEKRKGELGSLMTKEMGKPVVQARAEAAKCASAFRYYFEHAASLLADAEVACDGVESRVVCQPLGTIFAIMPWNFPFWQVTRFAAPALAAGNSAVLKHAPNTTGCGLAFAELAREAGIPQGVFQTLIIDTDQAANVIADPRIAAVTLTGSERAGRAVARLAGEHLKKCVLELGGSDPFVVLADADLDRAIATAVGARFQNNGQSCIAAKRFIVDGAIYDEFCERFCAATAALSVGDPAEATNDIGPLARGDLRERLAGQTRSSIAAGARLLIGGEPVPGPGFFYRPTVLGEVRRGMAAAEEELFGPVAAMLRVEGESEALELANATAFGLGGSVWTRDRARGERFARRLECGLAFVNAMVKSDPRLPFGGVKHSGYGRELGEAGLREFLNLKTLWVGA